MGSETATAAGDIVPPSSWASLTEVAEQLGVHYMTAYRYVRVGLLEAEQVGGQWRVSSKAVKSFQSRQSRGTRAAGRRPKHSSKAPKESAWRTEALADRLVAGDQGGAWRVVDSALGSGAGPGDVYLGLLAPALAIVGDRWESGDVTIADEHRATVVSMRLIGRLGTLCTRPGRRGGTIVLAAAPGERHALPTAILADLLRVRGFQVVDLGADVPADELASAAAREDRLLGVGVCATTALDRHASRELRRSVNLAASRTGRPVLLGGAAVTSVHEAEEHGTGDWSDCAESALAFFEGLEAARRNTARPRE